MACGATRGVCKAGQATCSEGVWGECVGQVAPSSETCDGEKLDENCDGVVNENCPCSQDDTMPCGSAVGVCAEGVQRCDASGNWAPECMGAVGPTQDTDICDGKGLDDDCDGTADEEDDDCECTGTETEACEAGVGICAAGVRICNDGRWQPCMSMQSRQKEICDGNGLDEDCDGMADQADSGDCECVGSATEDCTTTSPGICAEGTRSCSGGRWGQCMGKRRATKEVCDGAGEDEDCDGKADTADSSDCACVNGEMRRCGTDVGECQFGMESCSSGKWGTCSGGRGEQADSCNGKDDDCDGAPDNGCPRGQSCIEDTCSAPLPNGSYSRTCDGCTSDGSLLTCKGCGNGAGGKKSTSLSYRGCSTGIANCFGNLTCQVSSVPGSWRNSCTLTSFDGCMLRASCGNGQGMNVPATFNYAENPCSNVTNCLGVLQCNQC